MTIYRKTLVTTDFYDFPVCIKYCVPHFSKMHRWVTKPITLTVPRRHWALWLSKPQLYNSIKIYFWKHSTYNHSLISLVDLFSTRKEKLRTYRSVIPLKKKNHSTTCLSIPPCNAKQQAYRSYVTLDLKVCNSTYLSIFQFSGSK